MTLTRRTALAAPALLALPSAALTRQVEPDLAVMAINEWADAFAAYVSLFGPMEDTPEFFAAQAREGAAMRAAAEAPATTWAGVRAKLKLVAYMATDGDVSPDFRANAPTLGDLRFGNWAHDMDRSALATLAAGIDHLAAGGVRP